MQVLLCSYIYGGFLTMSEEERQKLIEKMRLSAERAERLSPDEAKRLLEEEGFLDEGGDLKPEYGGEPRHVA